MSLYEIFSCIKIFLDQQGSLSRVGRPLDLWATIDDQHRTDGWSVDEPPTTYYFAIL